MRADRRAKKAARRQAKREIERALEAKALQDEIDAEELRRWEEHFIDDDSDCDAEIVHEELSHNNYDDEGAIDWGRITEEGFSRQALLAAKEMM